MCTTSHDTQHHLVHCRRQASTGLNVNPDTCDLVKTLPAVHDDCRLLMSAYLTDVTHCQVPVLMVTVAHVAHHHGQKQAHKVSNHHKQEDNAPNVQLVFDLVSAVTPMFLDSFAH